ncbi:MAG: dephospho-CoA kinase [Clostridiales bacterium]|nr:dephospho-CoA kinase [Clostridiales bacterium]
MFVVGITGGIGAGKSSVADVFRSKGVKVLDADEISRRVTGVGGVALDEIRELLGKKAVDSDFALNRKYVASLVFSDRTMLDRLTEVVHKHVFEQMSRELSAEQEKGTKIVVLDVPIPVRKGFVDVCNQIWVISADESVRIERLVERGMDPKDAIRRMEMQMTAEEYEELADIVIENNGSLDELKTKVEKHIAAQLHERGIRI